MNKKRLLGGVTWLATISTLILWFPMIALGILKLKDFMTSRVSHQVVRTPTLATMLTTTKINRYEPEVVTDTIYALIFSVEDWIMMFGALVLAITLWGVKIRENKRAKK